MHAKMTWSCGRARPTVGMLSLPGTLTFARVNFVLSDPQNHKCSGAGDLYFFIRSNWSDVGFLKIYNSAVIPLNAYRFFWPHSRTLHIVSLYLGQGKEVACGDVSTNLPTLY